MQFLKKRRSKNALSSGTPQAPGGKEPQRHDSTSYEECEALAGDVGVITRALELNTAVTKPVLPDID